MSALTAQSAFLNNFENVVNRAEWTLGKISRDIKTLSYTSSKVDYSMGQNIYMLPSDMNLKIKTGAVGYNNKILVSDEKFSLGKNVEVNAPAMKSRAQTATNSNDVLPLRLAHAAAISHKPQEPKTITHNDEKLLWY